jgi:hypothetical protein
MSNPLHVNFGFKFTDRSTQLKFGKFIRSQLVALSAYLQRYSQPSFLLQISGFSRLIGGPGIREELYFFGTDECCSVLSVLLSETAHALQLALGFRTSVFLAPKFPSLKLQPSMPFRNDNHVVCPCQCHFY